MKNTLVGTQVTVIAKCQLQNKSGIVTWQSPDGNGLMVEIDGKQEAFAPEMVGLPTIDSRAPRHIVEAAYKYNMSTAAVKAESINFLQAEGYYETASRTIECHTFDQWLGLASRKPEHKITEPYHKSDLGYGL